MVGFLCFFFPPVIAVVLTSKIRKEAFSYEQYIAHYAIFAVIINGTLFWILSFLFNPHWISAQDVFTTSFSAKYISLSSVLSVLSAYILESIRKLKTISKDLIQEDEANENDDYGDEEKFPGTAVEAGF